MSAPLTSEEKARYSSIIDAILATADLATVSRKKIRMGLETALGGKDLGEQKSAIKRLIEERFDAISNNSQAADADPISVLPPSSAPEYSVSPKREANGHSYEDEVDDGENGDAGTPHTYKHSRVDEDHDMEDDADADADADADDDYNGEIKVNVSAHHQPPKKKQKRGEDADARLAAELQAQENRMARGRTTRNATGPNKVTKKVKSKAARKKSEKKVRDDSDDASEDSGTTKRKAGGGFQKPFNLSYPLQALTGETQLSRPQVVKKLWEYIKSNELQDPKDKRQIRCDDAMQAVFKQSKVDMFQMNKLLGNQLYPIDEE